MKLLHILSSVYSFTNFTFQIDSIISDSKKNDVTVLICDGGCKACPSNIYGWKTLCHECKYYALKTLASLNVKVITLSDYIPATNIAHPQIKYNSILDLKKIEYRKTQIGLGIASNYISTTRNLYPEITTKLKKHFDNLLEISMVNTDIANKIITEDFDKIIMVNGRLFDALPYQSVAIEKSIPYQMIESRKTIDGRIVRDDYNNIKVHTIKAYAKRITDFWNNSKVPENERIKIAKSFYDNRFNAKATNDKIYTKSQHRGLLPLNWNKSKHNIAIFNSSEDEFASLGGEFDDNKLFKNQYEGIRFILDNIKDSNIHFYLRIHPNLMNIKYKYHKELYNLQKEYDNVTIISADSKISSYSLMNAAEKVITFGSTMGIESAYWGKKSMVLTPCFYTDLNVCYIPKNKEYVLKFIKEDIPYTYNKLHTLMFSYLNFNNEGLGIENSQCNFIKYNIGIGKYKRQIDCMDLGISKKRFKFSMFIFLIQIIIKKIFIPHKEQNE